MGNTLHIVENLVLPHPSLTLSNRQCLLASCVDNAGMCRLMFTCYNVDTLIDICERLRSLKIMNRNKQE